jgi:hypothetical protein
MLRYLITSLALIVGSANISIASEITKLPTELICGNENGISDVLEKYGEKPFATMSTVREIPGVGLTDNPMVIFVNPETRSYTIVERITKNTYCIVAVGDGISPYIEQ